MLRQQSQKMRFVDSNSQVYYDNLQLSASLRNKLQTSGISSKAINKTLLVFADFFTVNAHYTQTG